MAEGRFGVSEYLPARRTPPPRFQVGQEVKTPQGMRAIVLVHRQDAGELIANFQLDQPVKSIYTGRDTVWASAWDLVEWGNGQAALTGEIVSVPPKTASPGGPARNNQ